MLAAFSISPLGAGDSVSSSVADAVRLVRESGLPNETNAMFTNVEGEWDEVMGLIKACVMKVAESAPRVSVVIKIDHRPGVSDALHGKVATVEARLAESSPPD
ncbi:MAG TPA: MTH1187 family thiamine-binding protein [Acidimicrobiales bacterium]|nr:MTH1187 family thiamine-binding protein [Acidimicrobiales bacterium]